MTFETYTDAILSALQFNPKLQEVVARKQEILDGVYRVENLDPTSVLFVGFNPAILSCKAKRIGVYAGMTNSKYFETRISWNQRLFSQVTETTMVPVIPICSLPTGSINVLLRKAVQSFF